MAPTPGISREPLWVLPSPGQSHAALLVPAVWTVSRGHQDSKGPGFAICKWQRWSRGAEAGSWERFAGIGPSGLCAFWDCLPKLTDMLSLVCLSVFQGPPPGCLSLSVTQRAEEGPPWLLYLPGPASEPGLWRGRRREGGYLSLRNMLTPY